MYYFILTMFKSVNILLCKHPNGPLTIYDIKSMYSIPMYDEASKQAP